MRLKTLSRPIQKVKKKILQNNTFSYIIIPLVLLFIALGFSIFSSLTYNARYTILPYQHSDSYMIKPEKGDLYAGESIEGEFRAIENNLGALAIRLHNYNKEKEVFGKDVVQDDEIVFRLKEKGSKDWYYQQHYSGGQFLELVHFPFGFPTINNSKGRYYSFEVTSLKGEVGNALTLTNKKPVIISQYQFYKSELLGNTSLLYAFIIKKAQYALSHLQFYFTVFIFFLPLYFYILWKVVLAKYILLPLQHILQVIKKTFEKKFTGHYLLLLAIKNLLKRYIKKLLNKVQLRKTFEEMTIYDVLIIVGLLIDIILIESSNILIVITIIVLWCFNMLARKVESVAALSFAMCLLVFSTILYATSFIYMAEKAIIWMVLFLVLGIGQSIWELHQRKI